MMMSLKVQVHFDSANDGVIESSIFHSWRMYDGDMVAFLSCLGVPGPQDPDWYTKVHPQRKNAEHMAGSCGSIGAGNR